MHQQFSLGNIKTIILLYRLRVSVWVWVWWVNNFTIKTGYALTGNKGASYNYFLLMSTIAKQLQASRRLEEELAIERHRQELEKQKIERQLEGLRRSRKEYVENQLQSTQKDYETRLKENPDIAQEHFQRQKRIEKEKSKVAQQDFERQRQRLLEERNHHDALDKDYRAIDKELLDLQAKSKYANEQEQRRLKDLENRRKLITKLLAESKQRELEHFDKAKAISASK